MSEPTGALSHIKVVDLTRARSGPTCIRQLSEMGAQVIKVEAPGVDDDGTGERHGFDFQNIHPNKRSLTLDLKHPDGLAVLLRMVKDADVIVENYRPDVKRRLGIEYETLARVRSMTLICDSALSGPCGVSAMMDDHVTNDRA